MLPTIAESRSSARTISIGRRFCAAAEVETPKAAIAPSNPAVNQRIRSPCLRRSHGASSCLPLTVRWLKNDNEQRSDRTEDEGPQEPIEARTPFALSKTGVDKGQRSPANDVTGVCFHEPPSDNSGEHHGWIDQDE